MHLNEQEIFDRLSKGRPIFTEFPKPAEPMIIGIETELGVDRDVPDNDLNVTRNAVDDSDFKNFPRWLSSGGYCHEDQKHLEVCTPEVSNPVAAVVYQRAILEQVPQLFGQDNQERSIKWYANNCDWNENPSELKSFGNHESYSTSLSWSKWPVLAPFLAARTLISGVGYVDDENNFHISQRARFIKDLQNVDTIQRRALVCTRGTETAQSKRSQRLHLICGECNLNQMALFLKIAFTALVVELAELDELPDIKFESDGLVKDTQRLSESVSTWIVDHSYKSPGAWLMTSTHDQISAIDLLWSYLEKIKQLFRGRDFITDLFIVVMTDTLIQLSHFEKHLDRLARRLDWVAKLWLCRFAVRENIPDQVLASYDLQYHRLGKESLQRDLEKTRGAEMLVSSQLIQFAKWEAPADTRASFRGWLVKLLENDRAYRSLKLAIFQNQDPRRWDYCQVNRGENIHTSFLIDDPFNPYHDLRNTALKKL